MRIELITYKYYDIKDHLTSKQHKPVHINHMSRKQTDEILDQSAGSPLLDSMNSAHMDVVAEVYIHLQTSIYS